MAAHNPPYTQDEQKKIVDYIIKNDLIDRIKGDAIWKTLEKDKVTSRTWQSMKQHYRKTIAWQLNRPHFGLDRPTLQRFQKSNNAIAKRENTGRKKAPVASTGKYPNFSDLSFTSSDSESEVRPHQAESNSQNGSKKTSEAETTPNGGVDTPNTGDLQQCTVNPTTSGHLQQSTANKMYIHMFDSSDTESDLDAELDLDAESQHNITVSSQDVTVDSVEVGDDMSNSVQVIDTTVDCIVINDTDSEIVEVI